VIAWIRHRGQKLPPTSQALGADSDAPGLLAAGGELTPARLAEAYSHGVFPWYGPGQPVLWWSPEPRMVLYTAEFRLARSLRRTVRRFAARPGCEVRIDTAFQRVIEACAAAPREGQSGTWIVPGMVEAYCAWQRADRAVHSFETWVDGELVGGLYGVCLGRVFYGESMFAQRTDASKIALAALVAFCRAHDIGLIDCQQNTAHLASFGAREITRAAFERELALRLPLPPVTDWTYHPSHWARLSEQPAEDEAEGRLPSPPAGQASAAPGREESGT
jgi:leucyl/phenylalanyl-tRNA--protein transferase